MMLDILIVVCVVAAAIALLYLVRHYMAGVNDVFGEDEHSSQHQGPGLPHHRGRR